MIFLVLTLSLYCWRIRVNRNPYAGLTTERIVELIADTPISKQLIYAAYVTAMMETRTSR